MQRSSQGSSQTHNPGLEDSIPSGLVVSPNAVLPKPVAFQRLKPVAGRSAFRSPNPVRGVLFIEKATQSPQLLFFSPAHEDTRQPAVKWPGLKNERTNRGVTG